MTNLNAVEIKAFVPAVDFELSKQFYSELGFVKASDSDGFAYFHHGNCRFLLHDLGGKPSAQGFMMHLLVEDVRAWHQQAREAGIVEKYGVNLSDVVEQPWGMLDFVLSDPAGVVWRFAQNV